MRLHIKIAAVAASLFLAATMTAHGADAVGPNDTARFLAGMPLAAESPLTPLTKEPAWRRHAKLFDTAFDQLDQRQLARIRNWAAANVAAARPTMFYMFSGPDFLYADAFYSKATTYVLSALEPIGPVPDLTKLPPAAVRTTLYDLERSLSTVLTFSFFITHDMRTDLEAGQVHGALPILYVLLARSGKTLRDVTLVTLDGNGAILPQTATAGKNATRGVKITFAGGDGVEKTLYYFSTNLANDGVRTSGFLKFCQTLAPGNSLVKSASYLMETGNFSQVRDFLVANSTILIQDDSGIPLNSFDPKKWRFFPFGRYVGPIAEFPGRYQPKYAELFRRSSPIDFGIGYRWRPYETNLLLLVKTP